MFREKNKEIDRLIHKERLQKKMVLICQLFKKNYQIDLLKVYPGIKYVFSDRKSVRYHYGIQKNPRSGERDLYIFNNSIYVINEKKLNHYLDQVKKRNSKRLTLKKFTNQLKKSNNGEHKINEKKRYTTGNIQRTFSENELTQKKFEKNIKFVPEKLDNKLKEIEETDFESCIEVYEFSKEKIVIRLLNKRSLRITVYKVGIKSKNVDFLYFTNNNINPSDFREMKTLVLDHITGFRKEIDQFLKKE